MKSCLLTLAFISSIAHAQLSVPAFTAYTEPDFRGVEIAGKAGEAGGAEFATVSAPDL